jgi:hypothetical protein
MTQYVQAWECRGPNFNGYVYTQEIALRKLSEGCDIQIVTIIRHENGDREYHPGAIASKVKEYREGK